MKHFAVTDRVTVLAIAALLLAASKALALSGYDLPWWTADGGGGTVSGGPYTLVATIGQPDTGTLSGGSYTLTGGFWGTGVAEAGYEIYLPLVLKSSKG